MIQALKERLHLDSNASVIKAGDTMVDIQEGRNAGCPYIVAVTTGAATREELEPHGPTHIIHQLSEIRILVGEHLQTTV